MSELDIACRNLRAAIVNPYAVHRYYERKQNVRNAWLVMSGKTSRNNMPKARSR